ncbi:unnamed protein product [Hyaloperonospora brassicae]|uniref:SCP domain-containing protein n=1 Tax=Hyaloperonospora brassicae TaxID=162125 RepID=A0AAV0TQT4_HYABA|nr:unnamed protein product [Hyaloperonospora brassicae]
MPRVTNAALMAISAIAISSAPTALGFQSGSGGRVVWENNCDFHSQDYRSMRAIPNVCGDVCASDAACTHWAWNSYNGGTCWLKSGNRSSKKAKWGTNCGYVTSRSAGSSQGQTQGRTQGQVTVPSSGLTSSEMGEMLGRINAYRSQNGLPPLSLDSRLVSAATMHSRDQANNCKMTHDGSNGSGLGDRIKAHGYDFNSAAENVAGGQNTVESVMTAWQNSPEHRANLLDGDVINVGFAKAVNRGCNGFETYWTQDFGRRQ